MKFGAIYCLYDDYEYIEVSVDSVKRPLDKILFLISDKPWNGDKKDNSNTIAKIKELCDTNVGFELIQGHWENETEQRNYGLANFSEDKIDYALIIDSDEIYHSSQIKNIIDFIKQNIQYYAFHAEFNTYWKKNYYLIAPREKFKPLIGVKIGNFTFTNRRSGITVDENGQQTKQYLGALIPENIGICYHLSYARTDEKARRKIETFSHAPEIINNWYENVWLNWTPEMKDIHPTNSPDYHQAVASNFSDFPDQLKMYIKQEKEAMDKSVTLAIITKDNVERLGRLMDSLIKTVDLRKVRLIIADSASSKEFQSYITNTFNADLFLFSRNIHGIVDPTIKAIQASNTKYFCRLTDDVEFLKRGWLEICVDSVKQHPNCLIGKKRVCNNIIDDILEMYPDETPPSEILYATGHFIFAETELWKNWYGKSSRIVHGRDDSFFAYLVQRNAKGTIISPKGIGSYVHHNHTKQHNDKYGNLDVAYHKILQKENGGNEMDALFGKLKNHIAELEHELGEVERLNKDNLINDFIKVGETHDFLKLFKQLENWTILTPIRGFFIYQYAKHTSALEGQAAEVGVYKGGSAKLIAMTCKNKNVHLFDTFEGAPLRNVKVDENIDEDFSNTSLEEVKTFLSDCGNIEIHDGLFPGTAIPVENQRFCFVHIDTHQYQSTKDAINYFYPRMTTGGVIVFDDWESHYYPGVTKAITDFLKDKKSVVIQTTQFQAVLIKYEEASTHTQCSLQRSNRSMEFKNAPDIKDINDVYGLKTLLGDRVAAWIPNPLVGDTISVTPTIREIHRRYKDSKIDVYSFIPEIFAYNSNVDKSYYYDPKLEGPQFYNKLIDHGYFKSFVTHGGDVYKGIDLSISNMIDVPSYVCLDKLILPDNEKWLEIPVSEAEEQSMASKIKKYDIDFNKLVIIHPNINVATRTWDAKNWQELTDRLRVDGYQVAAIGKSRHEGESIKLEKLNRVKIRQNVQLGMQPCPRGAIDLIDKFSILESKCFLERALALVVMDSGLMHIALSTNIRIVAMFTVIHPFYRRAWRKDGFDYRFFVPTPNGDCHYCTRDHRDLLINKPITECPRSSVPLCLHTVDEVYKTFKKSLIAG
ncbi:MAG: hypothetical protein A2487_11520 [Candidatus Raymondbacteria bacterium RifOxyC12_full_50_8]|nr:MAG: hypothetical protein A2487_11520 [Candidatus Raymondbacteria bacterium RifOxyC12_full_50_8]OGK02731.1 MAG: hypothetical protein A2350_07165 [Candidatus Raymondbacteria bacterium RifOxyB12_full_50_8]